MRGSEMGYDVIGNGKPRGLCGSGLVDMIAALIGAGRLTAKGEFVPPVSTQKLTLVDGEPGIFVTKGDIDVFQRAKAATAVGIKVLLEKAQMDANHIQRLCIGGAFGQFLNIANAQAIGLLPEIQPALVELSGNIALTGCANLLLSPRAYHYVERLRPQAKLINLSQLPEFYDLFLENLYLQPMSGD
jgi:uncharacterized 2Fe-2S/4Fe-4S cluster protein (DUF4445 family)